MVWTNIDVWRRVNESGIIIRFSNDKYSKNWEIQNSFKIADCTYLMIVERRVLGVLKKMLLYYFGQN